ncbi:hypothetical protein BTUL_0034g00620 [Botrytis tulipae]|uniref:Uncharacterized protein n=1 Tax=Botrytis tulipae TaxID=87230 RepID=A0A4Z1EXR5_9HELO|nr:hypothetical protein BTUL_0034g00620 [Botrytis tulipae]
MANTIMQDTVMRDADMQEIDVQDTVMQDTTTQDTTTQDTTTQDTVVLGLVRKIARMKRLKKNGVKVASEVPHVRDNYWKPTEISYLLHLYTINNNNISRSEKGAIYYGEGVVATILRDMTTESLKHSPGGSLHASDPWYPRNYTNRLIAAKIRCLINEEDDLAVELEADRETETSIGKRVEAEAEAETEAEAEAEAGNQEALREAERVLSKELVQNANQALRFEFKKVKKPVITDNTDA